MKEEYKKLLLVLNDLDSDAINQVHEQDFVNLLDAAGVEFEVSRYAAPEEAFDPTTNPAYQLNFSFVDDDGLIHNAQVTFNWEKVAYKSIIYGGVRPTF